MPNGYSNDLRERVLKYKDNNHTQHETCELFGIRRATLNAWLKLRRETGTASLSPQPIQRRQRKIVEEKLRAYLVEQPDAYLHEIGAALGVSATAVMDACRRYPGITRKKRPPAMPNAMPPPVNTSKKK